MQEISQRVEQIRQWLISHQLDAILIPHEDEYLGEYIPDHNERLQWLTGFTGSAGAAIITREHAAVFVDGRYVVQVRKQVPAELFQYCHLIEQPPVQWVLDNLAEGSKIAIDPRLHSASWLNNANMTVNNKLSLVCIDENPIDNLWLDRPAPVLSDAQLMGLEFVGQPSEEKRQNIAQILQQQNADAAFLSQLDSIAWLLNIRGNDVHALPVLLSAAVIHSDASVDLYIDHHRLPEGFAEHVGTGVNICAPEQLASGLASLTGKKVLFDSTNSNAWSAQQLIQANAQLIEAANPTLLPKAAKNATEIAGMKACHIRDGVAISKFLAWIDNQVANGNLLNEAELSDQLWQFRQQDPTCRDVSFDTISASAGNAAMCHYNHINQPQPSKLQMDTVYLVDSGGQYPDGTTDITRTIAIGNPSDEVKQAFTLVLKGHIALSSARFPKGTTGSQLDALARQHLWAHGFDYDHGTGHGVGHFLSVHEGPQRISKVANPIALQPGMVLSNEPGYYRADAFGIRIENLELVVDIETSGDMSVMGFESLTRAPIDKRLIDISLLTETELSWLNNYHQTVFDVISPALTDNDVEWLAQATSPLTR